VRGRGWIKLRFGPEGELAGELGRRFVERLGTVWREIARFVVEGIVMEGFLVEGVEELLLGQGDGLGVERGDLCRCLGLLGGALGFGGKVCAIAERVGVAVGDDGGDATDARWGGG